MKTQIIRLEAHDDLISARDKMGWSKAGRILLVWPERGRILNRQLDVILLLRHSRALGAQLAFVADDPELRYHAMQLGVMVFSNTRKALKANWRPRGKPRFMRGSLRFARGRLTAVGKRVAPRRPPDLTALRQAAHPPPPTWQNALLTRLGLFALAVLALLAMAAVLIPGAELTLAPQTRRQEIAFSVRADASSQNINLSGLVPARRAQLTLEGQASIPSAGRLSLPAQAARVELLLTNLSEHVVEVPAGSVVRSAGEGAMRFATKQAVTLPAGVGENVSVTAYALEAGAQGNIPAGQLTILEGGLGAQVAVTNPEPAFGGENRIAPAPTAYQRQQLYAQLLERLRAQALQAFSLQAGAGEMLITPTITVTQVITQSFDPPALQPADVLNLRLGVEFSALVVKQGDLERLATAVLDANLPPEALPLPETLEVRPLSTPTLAADGSPIWRIQAARQIYTRISEARASDSVRGLPPAQATQRLQQSLPLAEPPVIRLFPGWWPRLPVVPFRIAVQVQPKAR